MISYLCENIVLDDETGTNLNAKVLVTVNNGDMSTPLDRYDHLVAITGALENAVGNPISCFSYNRVEDAS